jgi:hypothetical protein
MERWSVQQRTVCVEQFVLSKSIVHVQLEFRRKFGDYRQREAAPSRNIISQWRQTGSVLVKARTRRNTVRSPVNIQRVRIAFERSLCRSVWRHCHGGHLKDVVLKT